jgi:hypothetical protein
VRAVATKSQQLSRPKILEWAAANPEQAAKLLNVTYYQPAPEGDVLTWEKPDIHPEYKEWSRKPNLDSAPSEINKFILLDDGTVKVQYQTLGNLRDFSFKTVCLFFIVLFHCFSQVEGIRAYDETGEMNDYEIAVGLKLKPIMDGLLAARYDTMKYPVLRAMFDMIAFGCDQVFDGYLSGVMYTALQHWWENCLC